jgi:hypothetical protein
MSRVVIFADMEGPLYIVDTEQNPGLVQKSRLVVLRAGLTKSLKWALREIVMR